MFEPELYSGGKRVDVRGESKGRKWLCLEAHYPGKLPRPEPVSFILSSRKLVSICEPIILTFFLRSVHICKENLNTLRKVDRLRVWQTNQEQHT